MKQYHVVSENASRRDSREKIIIRDSEKGGREPDLHCHENQLLAMLLCYRYHVTYEFPSCFSDSEEKTVMRSARQIDNSRDSRYPIFSIFLKLN